MDNWSYHDRLLLRVVLVLLHGRQLGNRLGSLECFQLFDTLAVSEHPYFLFVCIKWRVLHHFLSSNFLLNQIDQRLIDQNRRLNLTFQHERGHIFPLLAQRVLVANS